jgi:hypothetical protein
VTTVRASIDDWPSIRRVVFCCFSAEAAERYRRLIGR